MTPPTGRTLDRRRSELSWPRRLPYPPRAACCCCPGDERGGPGPAGAARTVPAGAGTRRKAIAAHLPMSRRNGTRGQQGTDRATRGVGGGSHCWLARPLPPWMAAGWTSSPVRHRHMGVSGSLPSEVDRAARGRRIAAGAAGLLLYQRWGGRRAAVEAGPAQGTARRGPRTRRPAGARGRAGPGPLLCAPHVRMEPCTDGRRPRMEGRKRRHDEASAFRRQAYGQQQPRRRRTVRAASTSSSSLPVGQKKRHVRIRTYVRCASRYTVYTYARKRPGPYVRACVNWWYC